MKFFPVKQIAEIDRYTIENEPVKSSDLMERAANEIFDFILKKYPFRSYTVFAGYGNNGGDGLVLARLLINKGFDVNVYILKSKKYSPDFKLNLKRLNKLAKHIIYSPKQKPGYNECIIDALFGSGLSRPLEGDAAEAVKSINSSGRFVISVDVPSGLMGEDNTFNYADRIVKASVTITLQFPKLSFFFAENSVFTGDWKIIPIGLHPDAIKKNASSYHYTVYEDVKAILLKRSRFSHKGNYGHALIYSGSSGKFGAAVLACKACIHSGAGLTTVFTSRTGMNILQSSVPEAMGIFSSKVPDLALFTAVAAGPGIGTGEKPAKMLTSLIKRVRVPLVLDADAINILASDRKLLKRLPKETILTPHPREFSRLAGKSSNSMEMLNKAIEFATMYKIIIVLKGAYSRVIMPDGSVYFNSTGNPGMAKGGSGDVLTGIIVSLLARGYKPSDAAILGVYIHGLAGDYASNALTQEYVSAGDFISYLCHAFKNLYSL